MPQDFSKPMVVSNPEMAFSAIVSHLMPPMDSIPEDFQRFNGTKWNKIVGTWFAVGLPPSTRFVAKAGIDEDTAKRHLKTILGSFEPKHEHKEAAVAYLMSLWFEDVVIP
jgi:hypothetical protein